MLIDRLLIKIRMPVNKHYIHSYQLDEDLPTKAQRRKLRTNRARKPNTQYTNQDVVSVHDNSENPLTVRYQDNSVAPERRQR